MTCSSCSYHNMCCNFCVFFGINFFNLSWFTGWSTNGRMEDAVDAFVQVKLVFFILLCVTYNLVINCGMFVLCLL